METMRISFRSPRKGPICFPTGMPTSKKKKTKKKNRREQRKQRKTGSASIFSVLSVASCSTTLGETIMPKFPLNHNSCRDVGLRLVGFLALILFGGGIKIHAQDRHD